MYKKSAIFILFALSIGLSSCGRSNFPVPPEQNSSSAPCASASDCPIQFECSQGYCVPQSTTTGPEGCGNPGDRVCATLQSVQICDGNTWRTETCADQTECIDGECSTTCDSSENWCVGNEVYGCGRGNNAIRLQECADTERCNNGACVPEGSSCSECADNERCVNDTCVPNEPECIEGDRVCASLDSIETCVNGRWETNEFCSDSLQCISGQCVFVEQDLPDIRPWLSPPLQNPISVQDGFSSWELGVLNQGASTRENIVCAAFLREADAPPSPRDRVLDTFTIRGGLSSNEGRDFLLEAFDLPAGVWMTYVVCDPRDRIRESNENNNTADSEATLTVEDTLESGPHDISVESFTISPNPVDPNGTITVRYTVANQGPFANSGDLQCALFFDEDRIEINPQAFFEVRREQGLQIPPNSAQLFEWNIPLNNRLFPGEWLAAIECLDYDFADQNPSNQDLSLNGTLQVLENAGDTVDLELVSFSVFPVVLDPNAEWQAFAEVCNNSDVDVTDVRIAVRLHPNTQPLAASDAPIFATLTLDSVGARDCAFIDNPPPFPPLECPEIPTTFTVEGEIVSSNPAEADPQTNNNRAYEPFPLSIRDCPNLTEDTLSACDDTLGNGDFFQRGDLLPSLPNGTASQRVAHCDHERNNTACMRFNAPPGGTIRIHVNDLCGSEAIEYELASIQQPPNQSSIISRPHQTGLISSSPDTCEAVETIRLPDSDDVYDDGFLLCSYGRLSAFTEFSWNIELIDGVVTAPTDLAVVGFYGDLYDRISATLPTETPLSVDVILANYGLPLTQDLTVTLYISATVSQNTTNPSRNPLATFAGPFERIGQLQTPLLWGALEGGVVSVPVRIPEEWANRPNARIIAVVGRTIEELQNNAPDPYQQTQTHNDWNSRAITLFSPATRCIEEDTPNNTIAQATPIEAAATFDDTLCPTGDVDTFALEFPEGFSTLGITVTAQLPVDGENFSLTIFGPNQEFIRQAFEPNIEIGVPITQPGTHYLRLTTSSSRETVAYRLSVRPL